MKILKFIMLGKKKIFQIRAHRATNKENNTITIYFKINELNN